MSHAFESNLGYTDTRTILSEENLVSCLLPQNLHVLDHDLDVRIGPYCACTGDSARVPANAVVP